jgi:siroheme synthase-like protein
MGIMVHLDVIGARVVVVGAGAAGREKVDRLVQAGAHVIVVDPEPAPELPEDDRVTVATRRFEPSDVDGATLVVAATNDPRVNEEVARAGRRAGAVVVRADLLDGGGAALAATLERGPVVVGVATSGASPALARWLRDRVASVVTPDVGVLADLLAERPRVGGRRGHGHLPLDDALASIEAGDLTSARSLLGVPLGGRRTP